MTYDELVAAMRAQGRFPNASDAMWLYIQHAVVRVARGESLASVLEWAREHVLQLQATGSVHHVGLGASLGQVRSSLGGAQARKDFEALVEWTRGQLESTP